MATVIIRPASDVNVSDWWYPYVAEMAWATVDEVVLDTGDYIYSDRASIYAQFGWTSSELTTETINSISLYAVANQNVPTMFSYNGTFAQNVAMIETDTINHVFEKTLTTNPATSSAWTVSDLNSLSFGIYANYTSKTDPYLYQLYITVDYTEGGTTTKPNYHYAQQ